MQFEQEYKDWVIGFRRDIHRNPELSYEETRTAGRISEELEALGIAHTTGIGTTGIVALMGNPSDPCIALRGDMDALPIQETKTEYNKDYCSVNDGIMHACGHDVHITLLMGIAKYLSTHPEILEQSSIQLKLIFQPAEEGGHGAKAMIEDGCLENPDVQAIIGQHCIPELDAGRIGYCYGVSHAANDSLKINIIGKGGHGARPEEARDPIVAGAALINQLQTISSRSIGGRETAIVTIGQFVSGTKGNVIPGEADMAGTIRTFDPEIQKTVHQRIHEIGEGIAVSYGVEVNITITPGYPSNINNLKVCDFYSEMASELLGKENVIRQEPSCGAEDFAYYTQKVPGLIHRLGTRNKEKGLGWDPEEGRIIGLHNSRYDVDEGAVFTGIACYLQFIKDAQQLLASLKH